MPKNKKGGKGAKKGKNIQVGGQLITKQNSGEEYGIVKSKNGNGRFTIYCFDDKTRIGIVRGKDRKRKWVNIDDVVLVEKWEFETNSEKCSIINTYEKSEVNKLIKNNEINNLFIDKNKNKNDFTNIVDDEDIFDRNYTISSSEEEDKEQSSEEEDKEQSSEEGESVINIDEI
tara:strand:+ start:9891 stop:10409 length:519 start_codon:yes stop_codon:yes gene_type:complete